jgi:hypothetical protein
MKPRRSRFWSLKAWQHCFAAIWCRSGSRFASAKPKLVRQRVAPALGKVMNLTRSCTLATGLPSVSSSPSIIQPAITPTQGFPTRQAEESARTYLAAVAAEAMQAVGSVHLFAQALGAHHGPLAL